jgi:hypothetical protein
MHHGTRADTEKENHKEEVDIIGWCGESNAELSQCQGFPWQTRHIIRLTLIQISSHQPCLLVLGIE